MFDWNQLKNRFKKRDYSGSSKHLKKKFDVQKIINLRLIIMLGVVTSIALMLIGSFFYVQIINADYYRELVRLKEAIPKTSETMRGQILDASGNTIVSNTSRNTINYYPTSTVDNDEEFALARKFTEHFTVVGELKERELKDLYLYLNNYGEGLVTADELKKLTTSEIDALKLERVTAENLLTLTEADKKTFAVVLKMRNHSLGSSSQVLDNATIEDIAYLAEHQKDFPGFTWQTTWDREYIGIPGLESVVGNVDKIPAEKLNFLLEKGYATNDLTGVSGLEYQYEEFLRGIKTAYQPTSDGSYVLTTEGRKGYDIKLTIDMEFQAKVEQAIKDAWNNNKNMVGRDMMEGIDYVVSDPRTGNILAIVALREASDGSLYNDAAAVFLEAHPLGSVVKGATVYMGLEEGVVKQDEVIIDSPLHIQGTKPRVSYAQLGPVTDLTALQKSSNVYMFMVAIRLGGGNYIPNQPLYFSKDVRETFNTMRGYFSQFGLGVNTGVDYPREENGYKGSSQDAGQLLEFAIGQYDNYNAMQLNQYISTIANGGYRMKPNLVKEVINGDTDEIIYQNSPTVLNTLAGTDNLARVRQGFRMCVLSGQCGALTAKSYTSAAKTGTSQFIKDGIPMRNNAFIAFAPFDNPEVATSCINASAYRDQYDLDNICRPLTAVVMDIYMNSK